MITVRRDIGVGRRDAACAAFWSDRPLNLAFRNIIGDRPFSLREFIAFVEALPRPSILSIGFSIMSASLTELLAVSTLLTTAENVVDAGNLSRSDQDALSAAVDRVRLAFGLAAVQHHQAVAVLLGQPNTTHIIETEGGSRQ